MSMIYRDGHDYDFKIVIWILIQINHLHSNDFNLKSLKIW